MVSASSSSHQAKASVLNMTKSNGHLRSYLPVSPALYKRPSFKFDKASTSTGKDPVVLNVHVCFFRDVVLFTLHGQRVGWNSLLLLFCLWDLSSSSWRMINTVSSFPPSCQGNK